MKFNILRLLLPIVIILLLDWYIFQAVRTVTGGLGQAPRRVIHVCYWVLTAIAIAFIFMSNFSDWHGWPRIVRQFGFALVLGLYLSKLLVVPVLLLDDLIRLGKWGYRKGTNAPDGEPISRSQFLAGLGLFLGGIQFSALGIGMLRGPYKFKIHRVKLNFPDLSPNFDGFRIVQLSDIHTGSWIGPEPMERAVKLINDLKPDLILFTGDLVNDVAKEAEPYIPVLGKLKAPYGVISSLGNHDYGDYVQWGSQEERVNNFRAFVDVHRRMGWRLLRNENVILENGGAKLYIAGCENWSEKGRFARYGEIEPTLAGIPKDAFTILLSHDPSHWRAQVLGHSHHVHLMLAGHTHGMQFGADFSWFKWSPVQWMYKEWMDLYKEGNKYLYVNRGLGFIGYPGRFGIDPEITLIELKKG